MREYLYEEISEHDFEQLVVQICKKLFGIGVQGFKKGPDGGRDARFHGVAELYPSKSKPWSGQTIIQAKHTEEINARFSDSNFSSSATSSILSEEIERLKKLVAADEIDNYILFSNRKLAGTFEPEIRTRISRETGIPIESIRIAAVVSFRQACRAVLS